MNRKKTTILKRLLRLRTGKYISIYLFLIIFTIIFGTLVYLLIYDLNIWQSLYHSLSLFAIDVKQPVEIGLAEVQKDWLWKLIYFPAFTGFFASLTTIFGFAIKIFENWISKKLNGIISSDKYDITVGLGEVSQIFIDSEFVKGKQDSIIIVADDNEAQLEQYYEQGFGKFFGTIDEISINFNHLELVLIDTGSDRVNIETAVKLTEKFQKEQGKSFSNHKIDIFVQLKDSNYKQLFTSKRFEEFSNLHIEFKPFSFYDMMVREMFEEHTILGNYAPIARTSEAYHIAVIGDGILAERIIYHLYLLAALPNNNEVTIHCISDAPDKFIDKLSVNFDNLKSISNIKLKGVKLSMHNSECYTSEVWRLDVLTNVIICYDNEDTNLECATRLHRKNIFHNTQDKMTKTKILTALFHNMPLRNEFDKNDELGYIYTFGDPKNLFDRKHLVEEDNEKIAKLIHYGYGDIYQPNKILNPTNKSIEKRWLDHSKFRDRESNRSQALHINTKLMAMGLKKSACPIKEWDTQSLLQKNREVMSPFIEKLSLNEESLSILSEQLPKLYDENQEIDRELVDRYYKALMDDKSLIAKLMVSEHERWMIFHYLEGWVYASKKDKPSKEHNCLTSLDNFDDTERKLTVIYDLYSILYIPNYLANTGYRIVPISDASIGITGHRNINMSDEKLINVFSEEMRKVFTHYGDIRLISPLADGADRLFVDIAIAVDSPKVKRLIVPMPFEKSDYKKDFGSKSSTLAFERYLNAYIKDKYHNYKTHYFSLSSGQKRKQPIECSQKEYDEKQYEKAGRYVVDNSDILFVLWDGTTSGGKGGTADIYDFALKQNRYIIHINPINYKVRYLNAG